MEKIVINSEDDIDFDVLNRRMRKSATRNPQLIDYKKLLTILNSPISKSIKDLIILLNGRQKELNIYNYSHQQTKTGAFIHDHAFLYKYGLTQNEGYKLVEIDMLPAIIDIITLISEIDPVDKSVYDEKLTPFYEGLANLFSGTLESEENLETLLTSIMTAGVPILPYYIHKSVSVVNNPKVKITDLFRLERSYTDLSPIEALIIPISYSLNTLQYVIVEELSKRYRRGEKRFGIIDRFKIYYFVKDDSFDRFMSTQVIVDRVPLNIKFTHIQEPKL